MGTLWYIIKMFVMWTIAVLLMPIWGPYYLVSKWFDDDSIFSKVLRTFVVILSTTIYLYAIIYEFKEKPFKPMIESGYYLEERIPSRAVDPSW